MSFFKKLKGELVDIIEFLDNSQNTIVYRFERFQNEIKNEAKLIVREGQQAVFINEGKIADVFTPGTYTLTTQNLPILSTLEGMKYGFNSPFKAEVLFVSTKSFIDQRWGTKNPVILQDKRFGMIEIRAYGTYTFKIIEAGKFIKEIVGTSMMFTTDQISEQLRSVIVTRFTDAIGESNIPIESYASNLNELSTTIFNYMREEFVDYGIDITKFYIENVSIPEHVKKEIFEYSRLNTIDLDQLMKLKAAKAVESAAQSSGGLAGAGAGMGASFAIGNQLIRAMNLRPKSIKLSSDPVILSSDPVILSSDSTPPPIPSINYHIAIKGKPIGPFNLNLLKQLAVKGQLTKETLVWKKGMADWESAGSQKELDELWSNVPPVINE